MSVITVIDTTPLSHSAVVCICKALLNYHVSQLLSAIGTRKWPRALRDNLRVLSSKDLGRWKGLKVGGLVVFLQLKAEYRIIFKLTDGSWHCPRFWQWGGLLTKKEIGYTDNSPSASQGLAGPRDFLLPSMYYNYKGWIINFPIPSALRARVI